MSIALMKFEATCAGQMARSSAGKPTSSDDDGPVASCFGAAVFLAACVAMAWPVHWIIGFEIWPSEIRWAPGILFVACIASFLVAASIFFVIGMVLSRVWSATKWMLTIGE